MIQFSIMTPDSKATLTDPRTILSVHPLGRVAIPQGQMTFAEAIRILGPNYVVTPEQVARVFAVSGCFDFPIPFTRRELGQAAAANREGQEFVLFPSFVNVGFPAWTVNLVNFQPQFQGMSWLRQQSQIRSLGPGFCRAQELVVAEGLVFCHQILGQIFLRLEQHWGWHRRADGNRICVGSVGKAPTVTVDFVPEYSIRHTSVGVCLAMLPEYTKPN